MVSSFREQGRGRLALNLWVSICLAVGLLFGEILTGGAPLSAAPRSAGTRHGTADPDSAAVRADKAELALQEVKARFLKLRNTDPRVSKEDEWFAALRELEGFIAKYPGRQSSGSALFDAAIAYQKLGTKGENAEYLARSAALYERLASEYPTHLFADDALVRLGVLRLERFKDERGAARAFERVISRYPRSDMAPAARRHLAAIESGERPEKQFSTRPSSAGGGVAGVRGKKGAARGPVIVIDPGHGGEDFGAVGQGGLLEKDVTLAVALALERILTQREGATVRLTRTTDEFVPLAERTAIANDFEAEIFLSLHTNASPEGKLSGLETYYLDTTDDQASRKLAERENSIGGGEVFSDDLQFMLSDLIQNAKLDDSMRLASKIHHGILDRVTARWGAPHSFGVRKGPFYVLVGAHMPCVLVELFFIDHERDGALLADPKYRETLAEGIATGVKNFLARS